jgi:GNAT superfamily N-acetyltransferase
MAMYSSGNHTTKPQFVEPFSENYIRRMDRMDHRFVLTDKPPPGSFQRVWQPLLDFNQERVGDAHASTLAVLLTSAASSEIIGGFWGRTLWGSLYTDVVFVPTELRRAGIGSQLVLRAEEEATRRQCHCSWLDTYEFQAKPFYEKLGYSVFGILEGPAPIYPRYFLQKRLAPVA